MIAESATVCSRTRGLTKSMATLSINELNRMEALLEGRILNLTRINSRYKGIVHYLRECQEEVSAPSQLASNLNKLTTPSDETSGNEAVDDTDCTGKLNEILNLARKMRVTKSSNSTSIPCQSNTIVSKRSSSAEGLPHCRNTGSKVNGLVNNIRNHGPKPLTSLYARIGDQNKVTTSKVQATNKPEVYRQQTRVEAMSRSQQSNAAMINCPENGCSIEDRVTLRENLFAQLDMLSRRKPPTAYPFYEVTEELYSSQAKLLSAIHKRPKAPRSFLYEATKAAVKHQDTPHERWSNCESAEAVNGDTDETKHIMDLAATMKLHRESCERHLKTPVSGKAISAASNEAILYTWYKAHRLLDLYSDRASTPPSPTAESRAQARPKDDLESIYQELAEASPAAVDNDVSGITVADIKSGKAGEVFTKTLTRVHQDHENLRHRIKILAETTIARNELKETLRQLKQCCELVKKRDPRTTLDTTPHSVERQWIAALKQYRCTYNCLVDESKGCTNCIFTRKILENKLSV